MNTRTPQSPEELDKHLNEEIAHLEYLCVGYDSGNQALAKKMAASLRLLLHDHGQSKSLLTLCGILPDAEFFNAGSEERVDHLLVGSSLTGMQMDEGTSVSLTFDSTPGAKQKAVPLHKIEDSGQYRVLHAFECTSFPKTRNRQTISEKTYNFFAFMGEEGLGAVFGSPSAHGGLTTYGAPSEARSSPENSWYSRLRIQTVGRMSIRVFEIGMRG